MAFATTNRPPGSEILSSPLDGQIERSFSYPRLLNFYTSCGTFLDQFVNCRLVLLVSSETRDVQELTTGFCFQQCRVR